MRLISFVGRNLFRRPARSALTVSGVAVAVGAVVALVGIARSFERSLLDIYEARGVDLVVVRAGGVQRLSSVLDEALGERIRRLPGVRDVSPGLAEVVSFEQIDLFGVLVRGLRPDSFLLDDLKLLAGRRLEPGDRRVVMLGKVLGRNLDKAVDETLEVVEGEPCRVVGIYESFNVFENGSMVMPLEHLQRLMDRQGQVTAFTVVTERGESESLEPLRRQIKALGPALEALPTREYIDTSVEIRMAQGVAWLTSTIALVVGTIGMINTMSTAVFERTRELAILRAMGWRKRSVVRLILLESLVLGLAGAVLGTLLAIGLTRLLGSLPASGRLTAVGIAPSVVLEGFAIAVVVGLVGGLYPAYRAAQLVPTEGLRHE